jgi:hypothetical protein
MNIEEFTAKQRKSFVGALAAAFPSYPALNQMLQLELNQPLANVAAPGAQPEVALAVINWAEAEGCLDELVAGALGTRPRNPKLKAFAMEMMLNVPSAERLEAIVSPHVPMQDPARWRSEMERLETSVCRMEMPKGQAAGSGFLIGDDLVMTNCHVAQVLTDRGAAPQDCAARFGYRLGADGDAQQGEPFAFARDWLVDSSPVGGLDYAVIRLAEAPARHRVPPPAPAAYNQDDIYLILQHPLGDEMKLSAGVFERIDAAARRVSYTANTHPGSSGSPVFNIAWAPVLLHQAGAAARNSGVILSDIGRNGPMPGIWTA